MFRLLIAIELLQFCQANYISDGYWRRSITGYHHIPVILNTLYLLQTALSNKGVAAVFLHSRTYHDAVIPEETDNITPTAVKSNSTTVVEQPNSMVHLANFNVSSIEEKPVTVSITMTSSGEASFASWKDKQHSKEIFKRRVAKMAIAPGYTQEVEHPTPSTARYESQAGEEVPSESGQYGKRVK